MPRLEPVIKTVLFAIVMLFLLSVGVDKINLVSGIELWE
jgi:hypothetical protein